MNKRIRIKKIKILFIYDLRSLLLLDNIYKYYISLMSK
jgi:hypothetical protein